MYFAETTAIQSPLSPSICTTLLTIKYAPHFLQPNMHRTSYNQICTTLLTTKYAPHFSQPNMHRTSYNQTCTTLLTIKHAPHFLQTDPPGALKLGVCSGQLVSLFDIMINMGIVLGFVLGWLLRDLGWRLMLGFGAVLALGILAAAVVARLPESPRWLIKTGDRCTVLIVVFRTCVSVTICLCHLLCVLALWVSLSVPLTLSFWHFVCPSHSSISPLLCVPLSL